MLAWPGASMRTQQGEVEVYGYRKGGGKMIVSIDIGTSYSSGVPQGKIYIRATYK